VAPKVARCGTVRRLPCGPCLGPHQAHRRRAAPTVVGGRRCPAASGWYGCQGAGLLNAPASQV